ERFPAGLASAMVVLAGAGAGDAWRRRTSVVPFHSGELLERRLQRLAGIDSTVGSRVSRRSILVAMAALFMAWSSGVMVLHPLPIDGVAHRVHPHCLQHAGGPLTHLFCRGTHWSVRDSECPHAV
ncbi:MAG: hypothetical protein ABI910_16160, partial [Gemmatimonadota bacterium]